MKTNNLFSFQRFILLAKQSLIINKKLIGISLVGFSGILFIVLMLFQWKSNFKIWENHEYLGFLVFWFFVLGIGYTGFSFPAFRSIEKSITYLLLPASASDKFTFEILTRIVVFIFIFPLLFWAVANLEGAVVHHYVPGFFNCKFSLEQGFSEIFNKKLIDWWLKFLAIQVVLFVFIAPFCGASHFSKSPVLKTLFIFSIIVGGYALLMYLLGKGLNINEYHPKNETILFVNYKDGPQAFFAIAATAINLCLLAVAWFRLKEKEA